MLKTKGFRVKCLAGEGQQGIPHCGWQAAGGGWYPAQVDRIPHQRMAQL